MQDPIQEDEILSITQASENDLPAILALFDESVRWLVERGIVGQWGTKPFSDQPKTREEFMGWISRGEMFVAKSNGVLVGTVALAEAPPGYIAHYWEPFPETALYLEALTTKWSLAGRGIGREILRWVDEYALQQGKTAIWLDCWADSDALVSYYRSEGYEPRGQFGVKEWHGQLFEKQLIGNG
jgi:GNAT superfamily N-acetyltransferase